MDLIDRNLRLRALPFIWNLGDEINIWSANKDGFLTDQKITTYWSFRKNKENPLIAIIPDDHKRFAKDIANKLNLGINDAWNSDPNEQFDLEKLFDLVPAISIREYTLDTRLDLVLSFVDYLKLGLSHGGDVAKTLKNSGDAMMFFELISYDICHINKNSYWLDIMDICYKTLFCPTSLLNLKTRFEKQDVNCMLGFIYTTYYRLLTTTTTNVYEIPYNSNHLIKGNGFDGFDSGFNIFSGLLSLGNFASFFGKNIALTTTPIWLGMKDGEGINIDITLNLFNDTLDHAITNFIFVNTIMPLNLPTQYAIYNQPPSLYDLRIEGGNRLYMCAGNFECNYKGVMRKPSAKFFKELKDKHLNNSTIGYWDFLGDSLERLILIPDIYEMTLHFKSLLPNNFNNFLFLYSENKQMIDVAINEPGLMETTESFNITNKIGEWLKKRAGDVPEIKNTKTQLLNEINTLRQVIPFLESQLRDNTWHAEFYNDVDKNLLSKQLQDLDEQIDKLIQKEQDLKDVVLKKKEEDNK